MGPPYPVHRARTLQKYALKLQSERALFTRGSLFSSSAVSALQAQKISVLPFTGLHVSFPGYVVCLHAPPSHAGMVRSLAFGPLVSTWHVVPVYKTWQKYEILQLVYVVARVV